MGALYSGEATDDGQHSDWWVNLDAGKCYNIVASGSSGVEELLLYLWGPDGRRVTERKEGHPNVTLSYCAAVPGKYHFQVKVGDGAGAYKAGLYQR